MAIIARLAKGWTSHARIALAESRPGPDRLPSAVLCLTQRRFGPWFDGLFGGLVAPPRADVFGSHGRRGKEPCVFCMPFSCRLVTVDPRWLFVGQLMILPNQRLLP